MKRQIWVRSICPFNGYRYGPSPVGLPVIVRTSRRQVPCGSHICQPCALLCLPCSSPLSSLPELSSASPLLPIMWGLTACKGDVPRRANIATLANHAVLVLVAYQTRRILGCASDRFVNSERPILSAEVGYSGLSMEPVMLKMICTNKRDVHGLVCC